MIIRFANNEEVCKKLAAYKVGEVVVFLKDVEFHGGIIKKLTKGRITDISLQDGIKVPTIVETDIDDFYANSDVHVFSYKIAPLGSDGEEDERGCVCCSSDVFEREQIDEHYTYYNIKKAAAQDATIKYYAKSVSIAIVIFALILCVFTLPMIPYINESFAEYRSFEQCLFVYPAAAVVIGSPLAVFIAIVATDRQYAKYRVGKILKRKQV